MTLAQAWEGTDRRASRAEWIGTVFPFRAVVLPWIVARVIVAPILFLSVPSDRFYAGALLSMDGQWFRFIALDGYDAPYVRGNWSEYPFFPLFPAIGGVLMRIGVPDSVALGGVAWLAALVAFAGIYRLAGTHCSAATAKWSVWVCALAPGALTLVIGYADALFLAGAVWALVAVDERRWWLAGVLAMVATASRPNGVLIVAALLVAVLVARGGWRAIAATTVPSALFLASWMAYLNAHAGDPFVFWSAKDAWEELSLGGFLADPLDSQPAFAHVLIFVVAVAIYAVRFRRQPASWGVLTVLVVLPPMLLGVVGLARYALLAFPMQLAATDVMVARGRTWVTAYLVVSTCVLALYAHLMVARAWVP